MAKLTFLECLSLALFLDSAYGQSQAKTCSISSESTVVSSALVKSLLDSMDPNVLPHSDCGGPTMVSVGLELQAAYKDVTEPNVYKFVGPGQFTWNDSRLAWDPDQWGGLQSISLPANKIWLPDITLFNSYDIGLRVFATLQYPVKVLASGFVNFFPPISARVECNTTQDTDGLDLVSCANQMGSWAHDTTELDVRLPSEQNGFGNFDLFDTGNYNLLSSSNFYQSKKYACCPGNYASITYRLQLKAKRKSSHTNGCCNTDGSNGDIGGTAGKYNSGDGK